MTTQTAGDLDVFAAPKVKVEPLHAAGSRPAVEDKQRNTGHLSEKIKPWHFVVVALVAGTIWAMAPKFIHSQGSRTNEQQTTGTSAQDPYNEYKQQQSAKAAPEPVSEEVANFDQQRQQQQLNGQLELLAKSTAELQGQVRELQAKVAVLDARPQEAVPKAPAKTLPKNSTVTSKNIMKPLAGFTLNTVYADQAWLQHDQRTVVVQVGDLIDGVRIEHIDPVARQVVTNLGVIR